MLRRAGRTASVYVNSGSLALVTGTALADQMSYLSKTMRLRVSKALYGPGRRRSGWWTLLSAVDGSQREASSRFVVVVTAG
jgi:hypothetical protein